MIKSVSFFFLVALLNVSCSSPHRLLEREIKLPISVEGRTSFNNVSKPKQISGYFELNRTHAAKMFYFFFEQRHGKHAPLILWMTGGPGCSSELAVFYENGPYNLNSNLSLEPNPFGWDVAGNIIYVDQPINTGFSFSDDPRDRVYNEDSVAADMLDFFDAFLDVHPEYKGRDLFITGESYAGHYVPAVSHAIHKNNKLTGKTDMNLKGLAIGNGLTDPLVQYKAYAPFALKNHLISPTASLLMQITYPVCNILIRLCNAMNKDSVCLSALNFCESTQFDPILSEAGDINVYDIRKKCIGSMCYDFSPLDQYLAHSFVKEQLGVDGRNWTSCSDGVYEDMKGDWMKNFANLIPPLLDSGIQVLIYAGSEDLICNWLGNLKWLEALKWSNSNKFLAAPPRSWYVNNVHAGYVKSVDNLTFIKINNAGHMVPMDQPEIALTMIDHFISSQAFTTHGVVKHLQHANPQTKFTEI